MSPSDSPQTWLAALCLVAGIGIVRSDRCDVSLSRSVRLGTVIFWQSSKPLDLVPPLPDGTNDEEQPEQALPITAVQVSVTAFVHAMVVADGWIGQPVGIVRPPCPVL
jgi:hypothetical protein